MARVNNYLIQAQQAKEHFLTYDQQALIRKLDLSSDEVYLYTKLFGIPYRIHRKTGDISRMSEGEWVDGNTFEEVMTLLDLVCDSRMDRFISGQWKNMQSFGLQFHQNLLEEERNPLADRAQERQADFCAACEALGGKHLAMADFSYSFEVFDGLEIALLFWEGDDEFQPRLRWVWDANANMYIRYETMYFAVNFLEQRITEKMR